MIHVENGHIITEQTDIPDGEYCTLQEFAIVNGCCTDTVKTWKKRGKIQTIEILGRHYVLISEPIIARKYPRKKAFNWTR